MPADGEDLFDLVCLLLVEEGKVLLRDGLIRDYRSESEALPVLRGRMRYRDQYLRRFGQLDQLECDFDEYDSDVADNQLVAAGLNRARLRAADRAIRTSAHRLASRFAEVCEPRTLDADWFERTIQYGRRNHRYRPAHELAKVVLRGLAYDDLFDTSSGNVTAFMLDMNVVFERFVERLVADALHGSTLRSNNQQRFGAVISDELTKKQYTQIRPDLVIEDLQTTQRVPIDIKYKLYDIRKVSVSDIYQTFFYAYALARSDDVRRAGLFFPSTTSAVGPILAVKSLAGPVSARIVAVALDVAKALEALGGPNEPALFTRVRQSVETMTGMQHAV